VVYHALNRADGRLKIFRKPADFEAFERILGEALARFKMRLCGYCIMSTHWHLVLWPRQNGDLSAFMKWITATHSHRWRTAHATVGIGHLYQGRFKSFPVQSGAYYLTLMRYVESNPARAELVRLSRQWPWSSLAVRYGTQKPLKLSDGPVPLPRHWKRLVNRLAAQSAKDIKTCIDRGRPYGEPHWTLKTAKQLSLKSTLRPRGRPKKQK